MVWGEGFTIPVGLGGAGTTEGGSAGVGFGGDIGVPVDFRGSWSSEGAKVVGSRESVLRERVPASLVDSEGDLSNEEIPAEDFRGGEEGPEGDFGGFFGLTREGVPDFEGSFVRELLVEDFEGSLIREGAPVVDFLTRGVKVLPEPLLGLLTADPRKFGTGFTVDKTTKTDF